MRLAFLLLSTVIITWGQTTYTTLTNQGDIDVFDSTKYVMSAAPPSAAGGCGTAYNLESASGTRIKVSLGEKICPGSSQAAGAMNAVTGDFWVDSGTVILRGDAPWGGNSKFSGIATVTHDSSAASSPSTTHYAMSYTKITLNGKCDKTNDKYVPLMTFDVAAGSGLGGDIGSTASDGGQVLADQYDQNSCLKVDGWGSSYVFKSNLVTAGTRFVLSHVVLNNTAIFENSHVSDGTDWIAKDITMTNQRASTYAFIWCEAADCTARTSGRRILSNLWIDGNGIAIKASAGSDPGLMVSELKVRVTNDSTSPIAATASYPVFSADNWRDNLIIQKRTTVADIKGSIAPPGGTLSRTYLVNRHTAGCPTFSDDNLVENVVATSIWYKQWILDRDCGYGAAFISALLTNAPWTLKVTESMVIGAPIALVVGIQDGCTQSGSNYCPNFIVNRNTTPAVAAAASATGLCTNHSTNSGWAGMCQSVQNNLVYLASAGSGGVTNFWATPPNGAYGTVGHNGIFNILSGAYQSSGSAVYSVTPGTGDVTTDPQLTDRTRNMGTYCGIYNHSDEDGCFLAMASGLSTTDARMSVVNLFDYAAAGQAPKNATDYATSGASTSDNPNAAWIGAQPPVGTAIPRFFYSDLTSGPTTGGENNHGAYICVTGLNLGSSQGSNSISLSGTAAIVKTWTHRTDNSPNPDQICFQPGSNSVSGNIVANVAGVETNPLPFTVRATGSSPDGIWFISPTGQDTNNGRATSNGSGGTGPKATWTAVRAAGFTDGDIAYLMGPVATGIEADSSDGTYAWYKFPGGSANPAMPRAFLGYPGATLDLGSNTEVLKIVGIGGTGGNSTVNPSYLPATNWVIGNFGVRCGTTGGQIGRSCLAIDLMDRARGYAAMHHDIRLTNIKVVAPQEDEDTAGAVTVTDAYNVKMLGFEFTNIGCGNGNTGGPDGSDSVNQSEQFTCQERPILTAYAVQSSGTTLTSTAGFSLGEFTIGTYICGNGNCATGQKRIVVDAPSNTTLTLNAPFSPEITSGTYIKPMSLVGGNPPVHALYLGGTLHDYELGWFWMHNNSAFRGLSFNPNQNGSAMVASTTANSEPGTGAALVTLSDTCNNIALAGGYPSPCTTGDPVSMDSFDSGGTAIGAGYDSSVMGSYWMKVVNQTSFYLYADPELTQPVTGTTNCSSNCGWFTHGVLAGWGLQFHDGRVEYQNGPALSGRGINPVRGPVRFWNIVIAHTGQGPAENNVYGGQGLTMSPFSFTTWYQSAGRSEGKFEFAHNTLVDIDNWTSPDLGSGGISNWAFKTYGGAFINDLNARATWDINNNIIHSGNSARGLTALLSASTYTGSKNLFYGGTFNSDYGYPATPTQYQNTAVSCTSPCAIFSNAGAGNYRLASSSGPASNGGVTTFVTRDLSGLVRPQGSTPALGAYEMVGASIVGVAPTISTTSLPNATAGSLYSVSVQANGTSPISWTISAGTIPSWSTLNPNTGAITGTPSTGDIGSTTLFSVKATNAYGFATQALSITVVGTTSPGRFTGLGMIGVTAK